MKLRLGLTVLTAGIIFGCTGSGGAGGGADVNTEPLTAERIHAWDHTTLPMDEAGAKAKLRAGLGEPGYVDEEGDETWWWGVMEDKICHGVSVSFRGGHIRAMGSPSKMRKVTVGYDSCVKAAK